MDIAILICMITIIGLLTVLLMKSSNKRNDSYKDRMNSLKKSVRKTLFMKENNGRKLI